VTAGVRLVAGAPAVAAGTILSFEAGVRDRQVT
jgi:hypothetical protein